MMTGICRSCGAAIIWGKTVAGKNMPLDAEPSDKGNMTISQDGVIAAITAASPLFADTGAARYLSHHATCPDGKKWRRK